MSAFGHNQFQYFSLPREITSLPVYCLDAGTVSAPPGVAYPVSAGRHPYRYRAVAQEGRRLEEFQLILIIRGRGEFQAEDVAKRKIPEGTVLVLHPDWWHRYTPDPVTGWHEFWVGFGGRAVPRLLRMLDLPPGLVTIPEGRQSTEIVQIYERILRCAIRPGIMEHLELAALVQELLVLLARIRRGERQVGWGDERFERVRDAMIRTIRGSIDISTMEVAAGCSRATIQRLFRERTGLSPYRYYLSIKIDAASWALVNTKRSLKEIAREYGFSDQYHFSRVFREIRGVSPGTWRERRRGSVSKTTGVSI